MVQRSDSFDTVTYIQEIFSTATGAPQGYSAGPRKNVYTRVYDKVPPRRECPAVPEAYPTNLTKTEWTTFFGNATCNTIDSGRLYTETRKGWNDQQPTWASLPGMSTSNGIPAPTRAIELEWAAAAKLLRKIQNSSLAASVTLAESKQTVAWVAQRASDVAVCINAVKKARWTTLRRTVQSVGVEYKKLNKARGLPKEVTIHSNGTIRFRPKFKSPELPETPPKGWSTMTAAQRWLEVRYAIGPLLSDVDGVAKNLAEFLYENRLELRHTWATALDLPPDKAMPPYLCQSVRGFGGKLSKAISFKAARMVKYSVYYVYSQWQAAFSKLQLTNAPLVVYEVTPYSFVFDWLVDVGDYLELANATVGCEFISGTLSYRIAGVQLPSPVVFVPKVQTTVFSDVVEPFTSYRAYQRKTIGSFPNFLPTVRSPLSTTHLIDALALIRVTKP